MKRYIYPLLLCLLIPFLMVSCQKKKPKKEGIQVLRLNLSEDPVSLDPRSVRALRDLTVTKQLFEGLTRLDIDGIFKPAAAESIEISEDLLTYTFHLREALWSNGDPVTSHDFKEAWTQVLDPNFATDYSYMLYPIKNGKVAREGKISLSEIKIATPDEKTLVVELEAPTPYFLELTAFPTYFPVNSHFSNANIISNGPFQFKKWRYSQELILEKNPTYWDASSVVLDEIVFSIIADNLTESKLFEKDELDWLGQPTSHNISTEILAKMKEEGKLDSYGVAGTFWIKFNVEKEPFHSVKIRKAFSYAINRQEIIEHVLLGHQKPAFSLLPPSMQLKAEPLFEDHNSILAKALFEEALLENGWTKETFPKIVLNYPPTERNLKIVELIQEEWQKAFGISVELASLEVQAYRRNVRQGLFQVGTGEWIADFNDPLAFLELFKFPKGATGMNETGWYKEEFASLLDQSSIEKNPLKRKELLLQAETMLMDEMPVAPVYHYAFSYIKKPYVKDVVLSPLGLADFKYTKLSNGLLSKKPEESSNY